MPHLLRKETHPLLLVELNNKTKYPHFFVGITMWSLNNLLKHHPTVFYELVQKCQNSQHEMLDNTEEIAKKRGLIKQDGKIHEAIKNVILSAVTVNGLEIILGSPIKNHSNNTQKELPSENNQHSTHLNIKSTL